jgi:hypothetical protein
MSRTSTHGTLLDGEEVPQFEPVPFAAGQELTLGGAPER